MPNLIIGSVPRGDDFFDREELISILWEKLKNDNLLLVAPRRFGKSGVMQRMLEDARDPFHVIYMDVEPIVSAADFMVELLAVLLRAGRLTHVVSTLFKNLKNLGRSLRNLPQEIDIGEIKVILREQTNMPCNWLSYGERVMDFMAKENLLLVIDEFAIMMGEIAKRDLEEAKQFLRWFRKARLAPATRMRFLIGGSVNLVSTLDALRLVDTINDLAIVNVMAFDRETGQKFIQVHFQAQGIPLSPEVTECILNLVGAPIPFFLAVLLASIFDHHKKTSTEVTPDLVKRAFREDILGGPRSSLFNHYRSRIDQYYKPNEVRAVKRILGILSNAPVKHDTLFDLYLKATGNAPNPNMQENFRRLMEALENDFYVVFRNGTYSFFSRMFQLWWKAKYGFQKE